MAENEFQKSITELARELRNNPTPAEVKLWKILRKRQLNNCRFLRQKPIIYKQINSEVYFFIADFYCSKKKLVIELDGPIHKLKREYDRNRDFVMSQLGLYVLRIFNSELQDLKSVKQKILNCLNKLPNT